MIYIADCPGIIVIMPIMLFCLHKRALIIINLIMELQDQILEQQEKLTKMLTGVFMMAIPLS